MTPITPAPPALPDAPDPGPAAAALVAALQSQLGAARIETHISWLLLDGRHAWKIKKPVRLPFLDTRTLATREHLCHEELRLNRRLAPSLYLDVVPIGGTPAQPAVGARPAIEWALRMRQFPAGALLSEQLAAGTLQPVHLDRLALRLADFQAQAAVAAADGPYGQPAAIEDDATGLVRNLAPHVDAAASRRLADWFAAQAPALRPLWRQRLQAGRVREGHGDLHLRNAVLLGDEVTAFDGLEFRADWRWIDVVSDIGFLVMDLLAHGRGDFAWRFLNAWLDAGGDHDGLPLLPWVLVYRAGVRALVDALRPVGATATGPDHLALALRLTAPPDPRLLLMHGLSGSGKSHVAQALLEAAGAVRLRSDVERKRLFGLTALQASAGRVPGGIYGEEANRRTYERLQALAGVALGAGQRVIVDAAFLRAHERQAFRALARQHGVPFGIVHCHAPEALLRQRVRERSARADDASEAGEAVLQAQPAWAEALTSDERVLTIDVDTRAAPDAAALAERWLATRAG